MPGFYLIHQFGKVASQTVEGALRALAGGARIERHHYLSDKGLDYLERTARMPGANVDQIGGISHQLSVAHAVRAQIEDWPDRIQVLTGFRDPLTIAISAFFQNLRVYCPWLTYQADEIATETGRLLEFFEAQFERVHAARPAADYGEALLDTKLGGPEPWFQQEFNEFYGVDVYSVEIGTEPFVGFSSGRFDFLLYRSELLSIYFPQFMSRLDLPPARLNRSANVASEKEYSRLYESFKAGFRPTETMIQHYYQSRFFQHFYCAIPDGLSKVRAG